MEKVFVNRIGACDVAGSDSLYWKHTQIRAVLEQAVERANRTGEATPVSLVWTLPSGDPLRVFRVLRELSPVENFFWEQPSRQVALVGAGTAFHLQTQGDERFTEAARVWQELRERAVIAYAPGIAPDSTHTELGPVLFGGFSFDPQRPRTTLWQDFPDGLLVLPRLLWRQQNDQATMTFSCVVQPTANLDNQVDHLCAEITRLSARLTALPTLPHSISLEYGDDALQNVWPATAWKELVRQTVGPIRQGAYTKIVLAREAQVQANGRPFSLTATLQQLRQSYPGAHVFAFQRGEQAFIGATPERLVHAQNGKLHTMALAGSAPRGANEEEDRRLGCELLDSQKNREEHEIVASTLRASLSPLCSRLWIADTPELLHLKNIQHLRTAIVGELLPDRSVLEALHALHPTPAVGGAPTQAALAYIREHENLDRGWYAGPIGWVDLHGNGEFAVALRSALLDERQATLFAGCGIVRDSDPEAEYAESCLKFQVILRSLSGEE